MAERIYSNAGSGLFEDILNWDGAETLPVSGADSLFIVAGETCTFDGSVPFEVGDGQYLLIDAAATLIINAAGLTFNAGAALAVDGPFDINADFTFGGAWASAVGAIDIDGSIVFTAGMDWTGYAGSFTTSGATGTHTITYNGVTGPDITIASTNALAATDIGYARSFTRNDNAVYTDNIAGTIITGSGGTGADIIIGTGNTFTSTGIWTQTASGNISNSTTANRFAELSRSAGVTSTLTGTVRTKKLSGAGTIVLGDNPLIIMPAAANFYTATCNYSAGTGRVDIYLYDNYSNAAVINAAGVPLRVLSATSMSKALTASGRVSCAALTILSTTNDYFGSLVANGGLTASGAITPGEAATTKIGKLTVKGVCTMGAGLAAAGTATTHELNLGGSSTKLTGTITGTNIVVSSAGAHIHGGILSAVVVPAGSQIHRFAKGADTGNTGAIVNCPSPSGPGAAAMCMAA